MNYKTFFEILENNKYLFENGEQATPPANVAADIDTTPTKPMRKKKLIRRKRKNAKPF